MIDDDVTSAADWQQLDTKAEPGACIPLQGVHRGGSGRDDVAVVCGAGGAALCAALPTRKTDCSYVQGVHRGRRGRGGLAVVCGASGAALCAAVACATALPQSDCVPVPSGIRRVCTVDSLLGLWEVF